VDDSLFVIKIISTTVRFFQPSLFIALKAILLNAEDAERRRERKTGLKNVVIARLEFGPKQSRLTIVPVKAA
jgi:hypothetical protein